MLKKCTLIPYILNTTMSFLTNTEQLLQLTTVYAKTDRNISNLQYNTNTKAGITKNVSLGSPYLYDATIR